MRIAVWHGLPSGGGRRVLEDQVRGLASLGHELHVWTPSAVRWHSSVPSVSSHQVPLPVPPHNGGLTELRAAWSGRRVDLDAFAAHSARCAHEIAAIEPDVVLAHPMRSYRPPAVAQYLAVPSVLYMHEPNRRLFEATSSFPWVARPPTRTRPGPASIRQFVAELVRVEQSRIEVRAETEWVHAFDEVLVNSSSTREAVLRAYGRLSTVSPPGVDAQRFRFQERPERGRGNVLIVGAMVVEKNPQFLVRAVAAAGASVERFTWVANYVDEPCWRVVEQAAADARVPLELRRSVSEDELLRCYAEADVFVYAPRLEPLGLAPLEANATGLPVVAVAEGGVRETVVDGVNGTIVEHDTAAFGAALAALLDDPDRARALGRSAREHVLERWSVGASIERLEACLLSVLDPNAPERSDGTERNGSR